MELTRIQMNLKLLVKDPVPEVVIAQEVIIIQKTDIIQEIDIIIPEVIVIKSSKF